MDNLAEALDTVHTMSIFSNRSTDATANHGPYVEALLALLGNRDWDEVMPQTPASLRDAALGIPAEKVRLPEAPGKWSVLQVAQHLADSELVFGYRLRMILAHDRPLISAFDQDLWAERLGYADADFPEALEQFSVLRRLNMRLVGRTGPDLQRVGIHAERGEESLAHMLRLYAGHDLLHLRQIARITAAL